MKLLVVACVLLVAGRARADHVFLHEANVAREMFGATAVAERTTLELSDAELEGVGKLLGRHIDNKVYPYLKVHTDHEALGEIFLLDVIGQAQPISFAIAIASDGSVRDVRVMVYRESHGDEIEDRRFHKQFVSKTLRDPIALGKDVDAISGATISSRAEAFAVKKGLALADVLHHRAHVL